MARRGSVAALVVAATVAVVGGTGQERSGDKAGWRLAGFFEWALHLVASPPGSTPGSTRARAADSGTPDGGGATSPAPDGSAGGTEPVLYGDDGAIMDPNG